MRSVRRMRPIMGCYVEVSATGARAELGVQKVFDVLQWAQQRWSFQDPDSELARLNRRPGHALTVHRHTIRLLSLARALMLRSNALFDCTVGGALVHAGHLPNHTPSLPMPRGRAQDIVLGADYAYWRRPIQVTLDGIAKGFALDLAGRAVRHLGLASISINAGGDLRVWGVHAVPVYRRELDATLTPLGALREAALASSGVYPTNDALSDKGNFPAHLVAQPGCSAAPGVWSVLARSAWRADALTKVAANAPTGQAAARVRELGGHLLENTQLLSG